MDATQEETWIEASARGDARAFTRLVALHQGRVRAYVASYVRDRMIVDDLCQDVFLQAFRSVRGFRREAPFSVWLLRIARSRTIDHLRQELRRGTERGDAEAVALAAWRMEAVETEGDALGAREREIQALAGCLEKLPETSAALVREHYLEDRRAVEIARARARRPGAVRMTLLRIRQSLRACIERQLAGDGP